MASNDDAKLLALLADIDGVPKRCTQGDGLTHLVIPVRENETFFRVEIIDSEGKRGFLSPFRTRITEN